MVFVKLGGALGKAHNNGAHGTLYDKESHIGDEESNEKGNKEGNNVRGFLVGKEGSYGKVTNDCQSATEGTDAQVTKQKHSEDQTVRDERRPSTLAE